MKEFYILIEYPESDWGTDLVKFTVPEHISEHTIKESLQAELEYMDSFDDYFSRQDMAESAFSAVADKLGCSWKYVPTLGSIEIR